LLPTPDDGLKPTKFNLDLDPEGCEEKTSKSRNWKKKSQNVMKMVKSTANCLNICYQTI